MTKKSFFAFLLFVFCLQFSLAQTETDSLFLKINLKFKENTFELNQNYFSKNDTLQISIFKFYISGIELEYEDKTTFIQKNSFHLIDIENLKTLQIAICKKSKKTISNIKFNIGIDSLASNSGALAGDLDPVKGMYWAWQSGYINMKIEGTSASCKTRKNQFQFHIGGYLRPFYAKRKIDINCNFNIKNHIDIVIDLSKLFEEINLSETKSIMIPGKKAMKLADDSVKMFKIE